MKDQSLNNFRTKLETYVLGCFSKTTDPALIEAMGFAKMDFVILDMEHGPIGIENIRSHITAAENAGVLPIVRVPNHESEYIGRVLDLGAAGIQVPSVQDPEQAREIVAKSKFHPHGNRGLCRFVRAANYAVMDRNDYLRSANENLVILQVEGIEGLKNFKQIIDVEGVDIVFIGPYDLSQAMGIPGKIEDPALVNEMEKLINDADKHKVVLGTFCDTPGQLLHWKRLGVKYLAYSVDINIFVEGLNSIKSNLKA